MSDVTFDMASNRMEVHHKHAEPWRVTLVDTGDETQTGGRCTMKFNVNPARKPALSLYYTPLCNNRD